MNSTLGQMFGRFGSRSLAVRLTLFAILIVVVTTGLRMAFIIAVLVPDARKAAADDQQAAASYIARDIDQRLRLRLDFLKVMAEHFPGFGQSDASHWLDGNPSYRLLFPAGLALYDAGGARIAETSHGTDPNSGGAGQDWFIAALNNTEPSIARLFRSSSDGRPSLTMAAPIRDPSGRVVAVLTGTTGLLEDNFLKPVYDQKIGEAGSVLVVDPAANRLVVSSLGPKFLVPAASPGVNPLHDKGRAGFRGVGETVNADGQQVLSAMASIPASGWFLVVQQPTRQAYRAVWRLKTNLLMVGLVSFLVAIVIIHVILRSLLGPLTEAAGRLNAMAKADAPIDFLPLRHNDEIGQIITGFNSLLTNLRENEAQVSHMAYHDALTGLPNLQLFRDRLSQSLHHARRQATGLVLLYLDLDGFKPVNDQYGHAAGDAVLREVARRVDTLLRKSDTVARIGGDEFAVILADPGGSAEAIAEKCRAAICRPIPFDGCNLSVGVSIGIAHFPEDGTTEDELIKSADTAMYRVKRLTKNRTGEACK
jgi:diguanylate cyclase (GGDEF)-like protein